MKLLFLSKYLKPIATLPARLVQLQLFPPVGGHPGWVETKKRPEPARVQAATKLPLRPD